MTQNQLMRSILVAVALAVGIGSVSAFTNPPQSRATGRVIALLAEGKILAIDVSTGKILAERVASGGRRYELHRGRLAHLRATDEVFAVLPDEKVPVLTAFSLKTMSLRTVGQLPGDEYRGLDVGQRTGRVYAFGSLSSIVSVVDPASGKIVHRFSDGSGRDNFSGAVSADERRIYVSYHGNASGVSAFDVSGTEWRRALTIQSHGHFALVGDTVLAATGDQNIIEVDRNGRTLRSIPTLLYGNHLMEFALDGKRRIHAVGSCLYNGGFSRTSLKPAAEAKVLVPVGPATGRYPLPFFDICGERISVTSDGSWAAVAALRTAVQPAAGRPGSIVIVNAETGALIRTIPTSSEVVDVIAIG